jgi:hypothetical protein
MHDDETNNSPRLQAIKHKILRVGFICSGTLLERTKVCGKPNCACASDPKARHGPYFEWNRREDGALRHRAVSPDEARRIQRAQESYQLILRLLTDWEDESARTILGADRVSRRRSRR